MDEDFYADVLDQISDGVYSVDRDRLITYGNGGAQRLTGYGADEVLAAAAPKGFCVTSRHATSRTPADGCAGTGVPWLPC